MSEWFKFIVKWNDYFLNDVNQSFMSLI